MITLPQKHFHLPWKRSLILVCLLALGACGPTVYKTPAKKLQQHQVKQGEDLDKIAQQYHVDSLEIQRENDLYDPEDLAPGMILRIPGNFVEPAVPKVIPKPEPRQRIGRGRFQWPSEGSVSSKFGRRKGRKHEGIDITASKGKIIVAAAPGKVIFVGRKTGYGKTVIIDHGNGYKTLYAHNQRYYVREGWRVNAGSRISYMGNTGRSTGIHLHFEIHKNDKAVDPLGYLPRR